MASLTELKLRAARAAFAPRARPSAAEPALGEIVLRPHQRRALERVRAALARHGGTLLADDVGRGKTFVALALARGYRAPLVVAPAALRERWSRAMRRAGVPCALITHESLSRGASPEAEFDLLVVDESHHFRTLATRRHAALAELAGRAPILLMSATPLQNGDADLAAQLALFLGSSALSLPSSALAAYVVREPDADGALPAVSVPQWITPALDDSAVLRALLALPAPPRALDAGDAGALRTLTLVRAWASSRAALSAALAARLRTVTAIEQCLDDGRLPSRRELASWRGDPGAVQLGLIPLLAEGAVDARASPALRAAVECEWRALRRVGDALRRTRDPDDARAEALRQLRERHRGRRILAFSERASTVRSYFARLERTGGVGMLTATEGRISSGRLARSELLARFAPSAQGAPAPPDRERVTLLLATDLLSEGLDLQDASVVVHLDLPWNPARMAQRVGRARRPGGAAEVHSYALAPPARSEVLLAVEARLRRKLRRAERTIGGTIDVLPVLAPRGGGAMPPGARAPRPLGVAQEVEALWRVRGEWGGESPRARLPGRPIIAGVHSSARGWIAALGDDRIVAARSGRVVSSTATLLSLLHAASGTARPVSRRRAGAVLRAVQRAVARQGLAGACGISAGGTHDAASLSDAAAALLPRVRRHERAAASAAVRELREVFAGGVPLGLERRLAAALRGGEGERRDAMRLLDDALAIVRRRPARCAAPSGEDAAGVTIRAVIVLVTGP